MEKVPIVRIIINTFVVPWNNLQLFSYALAVPILLLVCVWGVWHITSPTNTVLNLVFYCFYFIAFAYLAIICHQLILKENASLHDVLLPNVSVLLRFIILMVAVYLLAILIEYTIITIYINVLDPTIAGDLTDEALKQKMSHKLEVAQYIAYIPSMYIIGRFCLVFPATALGYKPSLKWSWRATKNNHFHILVIVVLFPWLLQLFLNAIYRENSTLVEQASVALLTYISAALGVFAISLTYKELYRIEQEKL
ncbi:MAG: hypothetical protein JAY80_19830 [Candidatus Thiodiazotropha lotti]|nr:hypothetical protein [Candidatus Thiodiazotropha lotti]MCW4217945.1 hypothetical protein [Candidatus Thiodiazotropha lotti]